MVCAQAFDYFRLQDFFKLPNILGRNNPEDADEDDFIPNLLAWEEPLPDLVDDVPDDTPHVHVNMADMVDAESQSSVDIEDDTTDDVDSTYFDGWRATPIFNELCRLCEEYLVQCNARNDFRRIVYLGLLQTRYEQSCDILSERDHVMLLNYAIELNHFDLIRMFYDQLKDNEHAMKHVHNLHQVYELILVM